MSTPYREDIMDAVRCNLGLTEGDPSRDDEISRMPRSEVLQRVLTWHGFIGWTGEVTHWVSDIYKVRLAEKEVSNAPQS